MSSNRWENTITAFIAHVHLNITRGITTHTDITKYAINSLPGRITPVSPSYLQW